MGIVADLTPADICVPRWVCNDPQRRAVMSEIIPVGFDLAKTVFQIHGADASVRVAVRVALANRMALIVWVLMAGCGVYRSPVAAAQAAVGRENVGAQEGKEPFGATLVRRDRETRGGQQSAFEHVALIRPRPANTIRGPLRNG